MSFFTGVAMGSHKGRLFGHHLKPLPVFYGNCITEEVTLDISWRLTHVFGNWNNWQHHQQKDMTCYHSEPSISHHLPSPENWEKTNNEYCQVTGTCLKSSCMLAFGLGELHEPMTLVWIGSSSHTWCPNVWGVRQDENVVNLAYEIVTMKGEFWVSVSNCWESTNIGPSWWYEPKLKNISQIGSFPQVRVKVKTLWTHHLDMV